MKQIFYLKNAKILIMTGLYLNKYLVRNKVVSSICRCQKYCQSFNELHQVFLEAVNKRELLSRVEYRTLPFVAHGDNVHHPLAHFRVPGGGSIVLPNFSVMLPIDFTDYSLFNRKPRSRDWCFVGNEVENIYH